MKDVQENDSVAIKRNIKLLDLLFQIEELRQENNKRFDKQDKVLASILSVLQMLSGQFAGVKETPEKVENHEKIITDLEVQVRMMRR